MKSKNEENLQRSSNSIPFGARNKISVSIPEKKLMLNGTEN